MKKSSELDNLTIKELKIVAVDMQKKIDLQEEQLNSAKNALQEANEYNVKLAYCTRLFAEVHLTTEEKTAIAQEFDRALSSDQVQKTYNKYSNYCWKGNQIS